MISSRFLLLCTVALGLGSGCAVGPDYRKPALPSAPAALGSRPAETVPTATHTASAPWWARSGSPGLAAAVEQALANNRDLRAASARLAEARALRKEGRAAFLPVASISAGYRRQLDSTVFYQGVPRSARDQYIFDVGIDSSWELDLFGRLRRTGEAGSALAAAAEADLAQVRQVIAAETARAYVEYHATGRLLPERERVLHAAREARRLLALQIEAGKVLPQEQGRAETDLASAEVELRELRLAQQAARNRLVVLMGGHAPIEVSPSESLALPSPALPTDPAAVLNHRPDVLAAERRLAAATAAIGISKADYFPTLSFDARIGAEATRIQRLDRADANAFAFGPRLRWDLLNFQRIKARVEGAEARTAQALAAWENTVLLAVEEIDNALARRNDAGERLAAWSRAAASMTEARRIAGERHALGVADPLALLAAEQADALARAARIQAEAELANATIFLQQSLASES